MKYLFFPLLILFTTSLHAQNCDPEQLQQTPGKWKEAMPGSQTASPADLAREKNSVTLLHNMIKSKYSPMGMEINFNGSYSRPAGNLPLNIFTYSIWGMHYYCNENKIKIADETSTTLRINSNWFEYEVFDTAHGDRAIAEGFNVMYEMPKQQDGYWSFRDRNESLGFGRTGKSRIWLITYNGKLPFSFVTRKEFLEKRKRSLYVQMQMSAEGSRDVLRRIEIEKKYKAEEYKNDPVKMEKYLRLDYNQVKERYQKYLAENDEPFHAAINNINEQLKASASELNQPAIVKQDPHDHLSYLFTTEDDPFCRILIEPNPQYFNTKLPASSPLFLFVFLKWYHTDPVATKFAEDINNAIDFNLLKNMIGKQ